MRALLVLAIAAAGSFTAMAALPGDAEASHESRRSNGKYYRVTKACGHDCVRANAQARQNHGACADKDCVCDAYQAAKGCAGGYMNTLSEFALVVDAGRMIDDTTLTYAHACCHHGSRQHLRTGSQYSCRIDGGVWMHDRRNL